jgi:hypothetical protein
VSDLPDWQKADAAQLAEALTRRSAEQIQFKPLGKAVLVEMRSPSSLITLAGDGGKRAFILETGPKVEELAVGDEVALHPDRRYLKLEAVFGDPGKDKYLCADYESDIIVVVKRG